jgi:3-methyladenine DNA glycosylase AlkD
MPTTNAASSTAARVREALGWFERHKSGRVREQMKTRYGIDAPRAYGVPVGAIQRLGKRLGRDHELAAALWRTGWYEARMLTAFVEDPARVTAPQMDRWARDFDNWAIVDTLCFKLFDQTPHAWPKAVQWASRREEFVRRAGIVLLACLALHDKQAGDRPFLKALGLLERAATDERNFVRKAVSWAFRGIGGRNAALNSAATATAERLSKSNDPTARSIGKEALRDLTKPALRRRLAARKTARSA